MNEQPNYLADMRSAAVGLHELYTSYIAAGFTQKQAFELAKAAMAAAVHAQNTPYNN